MQPQPAELPRECFVPLYADSLHDLASPANQISTLFELFRRRQGQAPADDDEALLNMIQISTERLQKLMSALRDFVRVTSSPREFRQCDTGSLLTGAVNALDQPIRESQAQIVREELPSVYCDPSQITHVFINLIDNALKFHGAEPVEVRISAAERSGDWLFSAQDNGIGIDPRYHEAVFHMFKRIQGDRVASAGAGLAISRRIIEQHGGRLWLESEPSRGSTFLFTLPKKA